MLAPGFTPPWNNLPSAEELDTNVHGNLEDRILINFEKLHHMIVTRNSLYKLFWWEIIFPIAIIY